MSKYKRPDFNGGWYVEVETLKGTWAKVVWSSKRQGALEAAEALNAALGFPPDEPWPVARVVKNKRKK
jgi:hypothetical protein